MIEIFNRHENKYLINKSIYEKILPDLLFYMDFDKNNKNGDFYPICNVYFDDFNNQLIRKSLSKPKYKEKIRVRSYGVIKDDEFVFLELKKKILGVVNKRRIKIKYLDVFPLIMENKSPEILDGINIQILNEIKYFISRYKLNPKVYISYDRIGLFSKESKDLRVTFDHNILTRRNEVNLTSGIYGDHLMNDDFVLMEIKAEKGIPIWLSKLLSENKIYKGSFSKYGNEFKKYLEFIN